MHLAPPPPTHTHTHTAIPTAVHSKAVDLISFMNCYLLLKLKGSWRFCRNVRWLLYIGWHVVVVSVFVVFWCRDLTTTEFMVRVWRQ